MDTLTPEQRRFTMRRVKSENTGPELAVRRIVHGMGFRYKLHDRNLPGRPDLVFPARRKAIFVHGCFWHQHSCAAAARPVSRSRYWNDKLDANIQRDRRNLKALRSSGWSILIVWECQIRRQSTLAGRLRRFLSAPA